MWSFKPLGPLSAALFMATGGCSDSPTGTEHSYPVSWSSGYRMADLLSEPRTVEKQQDLQGFLDASWYAEMPVTGTKSSDRATFSNCKTYLSEATERTHTLRENQINAFLEIAAMCRATDVLLKATAARLSNIPDEFFNRRTPEKFPVALALEISETESARHERDESVEHWGDVNKQHRIEPISNDQVKFHHDAGMQHLALVGRGDFNGDEVEDLLISSRDSVAGGSYFNIRLFALSVDTKGQWQLIEEFTY